MTTQRHRIVVEGDDATNYSAYSPDIPGVVATGATREECERELREAIEFHLEGLEQDDAADSADAATLLLAFEDVSMSYRDGRRMVTVLHRASFAINRGVHVGIMGPRRSGKSTLLRLAAGVQKPGEGVVRIEGRDIHTMSVTARERLRRRVAIVAASDRPHANTRVSEYVALPLLANGASLREARRHARRALDRLGRFDQADDLMGSLSIAEHLWVALARALVLEPSLLLVDEPGVIPGHVERQSFLEALRSLANERLMTLMIASEEPNVLRGLDSLLAIGGGELRAVDPVEPRAVVIDFPTRSAAGKDGTNR